MRIRMYACRRVAFPRVAIGRLPCFSASRLAFLSPPPKKSAGGSRERRGIQSPLSSHVCSRYASPTDPLIEHDEMIRSTWAWHVRRGETIISATDIQSVVRAVDISYETMPTICHPQPYIPVLSNEWLGKCRTVRSLSAISLAIPIQKQKPKRASHCIVYAASSSLTDSIQDEMIFNDDLKNGGVHRIEIKTLRDCRLGIARYPDFVYDAGGGGGDGTIEMHSDGRMTVDFTIANLYIPPVESKTTRFLGLPLPPFICIQIVPQNFKGVIENATGKVELEFSANFLFSIGSLYRAPPLLVETLLTTETAKGRLREGKGRRLDSCGNCQLVGVATVAPVKDALLNAFLTLPTECLAIMQAQLIFSAQPS